LCGEQVFQGRHLHRDVAVKVLQLDGGLVHAVQREVRWQHESHQTTGSFMCNAG
jgi:hypothetical protein